MQLNYSIKKCAFVDRRLFGAVVLLLLCPACFAQTWFRIGAGGGAVTAPIGTTLRYGSLAGTYSCDSPPHKSGAASVETWSLPVAVRSGASFAAGDAFFGGDPIYCVVKEVDALETASEQIVTYNGRTVIVPALAVVITPDLVFAVPPGTPAMPCWRGTVNGHDIAGVAQVYSMEICQLPSPLPTNSIPTNIAPQ